MVARPRGALVRPTLRVLLVELSTSDATSVVQALQQTGRQIEYERVETTDAMRLALARKPWDVVISDWSAPPLSGRAALDLLKELKGVGAYRQ